ncbi:hypothetical protein HKX48_007098 [Thoreauomyces humboldtii]|nr:hypothetical protein HKX48_007098 [Thoreauomyces humboldtii]
MSGKRPVGAGSMYASGKSQPSSNPDAASSRSTTPTDLTLTPLGGPTPIPPAGITDKYGLYGLIDLIRLTDPDANMIHLGCDLTSLGLDLATNDPLYSTFMSPFSEHPTLGSEPQFTLPGCYNLLQPPPPAMTKVSSFSDETLFYVFYAQPREALQEAAAQELYNRSWRFHKELKLWVSKDRSPESIAAEAAISTKGAGFERGIFIFFDPGVWTRVKKEWVVYYDQLEERGIYGAGVNGLPTTGSASGTPASSEEAENTGSATTAVTTGGTPAHVSSSSSPAAGGFGNDAGLQRPGGSSGWAASPQPTNGEVTAGR